MSLAVRTLSLEELGTVWDSGLDRWERVTLFSRWIYLQHLQDVDVLTVSDGGETVAAFPVPIVVQNGVRRIARRSYMSPYFPILFRPDHGPHPRAERRRRAAIDALLTYIQREYVEMVLPLHPDLTDMVPFQRAHVQLELRATYELSLASLDTLWRTFDPAIRNHLRRARTISIKENSSLAAFDFESATFYEDVQGRQQWRALARDLAAAGQATALIARREDRSVGGLLFAHDHHTGYNLLSYFDRSTQARGTPSALIWAAAGAAASRGLQRFDLEGSVLPGVEAFYQQFGGIRRPYFQVHWHANEERQTPILYRYEDKAHACG